MKQPSRGDYYSPRYTLGILLSLVFAANLVWMACLAWKTYLLTYNDYGFLNYVLESTRHGLVMRAPQPENHNHLAIQFHLLLFPIAYLRYVWNSPMLLHAAQSLAMVAGIVPLYAICMRLRMPSVGFAIVSIFYFCNRFFLTTFFSYHFEEFYPVLLLSFFALYLYQRKMWAFAALFLSQLLRADYALYFGASCLLFSFVVPKERRFWLACGGIGILWFTAAHSIAGHLYNPNHIFADRIASVWKDYGSTLPEVIFYFITHPVSIARMILEQSDLLKLLESFAWFPVLIPFSWGILPYFVFLTTYPQFHGHLFDYASAYVLPLLLFSFAIGLQKILAFVEGRTGRFSNLVFAVFLIATVGYHAQHLANYTSSLNQKWCFLWRCGETFRSKDPRWTLGDSLLDHHLNNHSESVAAAASLYPRIAWRPLLTEDRFAKQLQTCWMVFDMLTAAGAIEEKGRAALLEDFLNNASYKKIVDQSGFIFFRKKDC